jgi:hypothetical protein
LSEVNDKEEDESSIRPRRRWGRAHPRLSTATRGKVVVTTNMLLTLKPFAKPINFAIAIVAEYVRLRSPRCGGHVAPPLKSGLPKHCPLDGHIAKRYHSV